MSDKHLSTQFDAELASISTRVLEMGGLVEQQVSAAVEALGSYSESGATAVLKNEERVNAMEIDIDRELSGIIARRQPTARAELEAAADEPARRRAEQRLTMSA
jgi:phosphate transport system protein